MNNEVLDPLSQDQLSRLIETLAEPAQIEDIELSLGRSSVKTQNLVFECRVNIGNKMTGRQDDTETSGEVRKLYLRRDKVTVQATNSLGETDGTLVIVPVWSLGTSPYETLQLDRTAAIALETAFVDLRSSEPSRIKNDITDILAKI